MIAKLLQSLPAIILAGGLLFAFGAPNAGAASTCEARIDRAAARLSNDVYHHGRYSYQANHDRARLDRLYEFCRVPSSGPRLTQHPMLRPIAHPIPRPIRLRGRTIPDIEQGRCGLNGSPE